MSEIAKVKIIKARHLVAYMWLRKEMGYGIKESKDMSKDGSVVDFHGDYIKAVEFYEHMISNDSSVELIIHSRCNRADLSARGAAVVLGDVEELDKYSDEYESQD